MPKVAINAGHCPGLDSGACGEYSQEAIIVRDVARVVCDDLKKVGYETIFIQEDDLGDIADIANSFGADAFVSIHCNSAASSAAHGTETFYYAGSVNGAKLAACVQDQLIDTMELTDRGLKTANFAVLRLTDMPACLAELAFISNPDEEYYLNNHVEVMAHAIARGVTDYFASK